MTAIALTCRKAGSLGLFVWLVAGLTIAGAASGLAEPSLLQQLEKGFGPAPAPPRKSLMPPLRIQVAKAEANFAPDTNAPIVVITMAPRSGRMFYELTGSNVGRRLLLRIDGSVVAEPIIREPIKGGVVQISGDMTVNDTMVLAERLNKGEAKVEVELVSD